jgi:hypothetical protein
LPRAYLVGRASVLDGQDAAARLADSSFDPRREAVLAASETATALTESPQAATGTVDFEIDQPERVRLAVSAPAPSVLVLSDSWFPGWRATVNGQDVPVERANILFRAVQVPAGPHTVEFRYEPRSMRIGALISGGSALAVVALAVGGAIWQRRTGRVRPAA